MAGIVGLIVFGAAILPWASVACQYWAADSHNPIPVANLEHTVRIMCCGVGGHVGVLLLRVVGKALG